MGRIALIGENSIEYVSALLDIWNSGNCALLLDWRIPMSSAYEMMVEAGATKCYIDESVSKKITKADFPNIEFIEYKSNGKSATKLSKEIYNKFQENYSKDDAVVIYSSGTTGKSKGIILSHYAINTNADAIQDYMKLTPDDCLYICKSLSHSSTLTGELLVALKYKIALMIAPTIVPPRFVLNNISEFKVTTICVNPTLLKMYSEELQRKNYNILSLKTIYVSGSILNDKIYEVSHDAFNGVPIYNVYGLSEAGPRVTAQRADCCKNNSVGKSIKGVEIAVIGDNGQALPKGTRGIIHVNTQTVYSGYICGEEKNQSLYNDWLNTGDIGFIDESGELHIVDRVDDVIIIDSHKIYPSDVEKQILLINYISECVVTLIRYNDNDIIGCVYICDREINFNIRKELNKTLMPYEIPQLFIRVTSIPHIQGGKISKQDIKQILIGYCSNI